MVERFEKRWLLHNLGGGAVGVSHDVETVPQTCELGTVDAVDGLHFLLAVLVGGDTLDAGQSA